MRTVSELHVDLVDILIEKENEFFLLVILLANMRSLEDKTENQGNFSSGVNAY